MEVADIFNSENFNALENTEEYRTLGCTIYRSAGVSYAYVLM